MPPNLTRGADVCWPSYPNHHGVTEERAFRSRAIGPSRGLRIDGEESRGRNATTAVSLEVMQLYALCPLSVSSRSTVRRASGSMNILVYQVVKTLLAGCSKDLRGRAKISGRVRTGAVSVIERIEAYESFSQPANGPAIALGPIKIPIGPR
jgi:hypothetical protein